DLRKWRLPASNLPAGGYLVVFASGKDRQTPGAPLHTNFKLDAAGGYLALVSPDGATITSQSAYPEQHTDVSYGIGREINPVPLIGRGTPVRVLVPTSGGFGLLWSGGAEPFSDLAWLPAMNGAGVD